MLIPVSRTASRPGSSYRVVSPVVSHHHFNARRRPGLGQPATVWLARHQLYNPWDRWAAGLGQLTYEKAKEILMYGTTRGYTDEQIRAANLVVYPARTAAGALVSAPRIAAGEFEIETEAAAGERAVVQAGPASLAIPPKPVRGPRPPLYRDFETCIPGDQACIDRNAARTHANSAILKNAGMDYMRALCERACALNTRAGHPELCRNCAVQFARVPVPSAPGTRRTASQAPVAFTPAETPKVEAVPPAAAGPSPEAEAGDLRDRERLASAEKAARTAAGTAATFLMGSWVGGIPNWVLIAGAAATGLVLLDRKR